MGVVGLGEDTYGGGVGTWATIFQAVSFGIRILREGTRGRQCVHSKQRETLSQGCAHRLGGLCEM